MGLVGFPHAAGVNWADAATLQGTAAGASALPAILMAMAILGVVFRLMIKAQQPARIRARANNRRR